MLSIVLSSVAGQELGVDGQARTLPSRHTGRAASLPPSRPLQSSQEHQEGTNTRGTQFLLFINKGKNKQKKFVEVSFYKFPVFHFYR